VQASSLKIATRCLYRVVRYDQSGDGLNLIDTWRPATVVSEEPLILHVHVVGDGEFITDGDVTPPYGQSHGIHEVRDPLLKLIKPIPE